MVPTSGPQWTTPGEPGWVWDGFASSFRVLKLLPWALKGRPRDVRLYEHLSTSLDNSGVLVYLKEPAFASTTSTVPKQLFLVVQALIVRPLWTKLGRCELRNPLYAFWPLWFSWALWILGHGPFFLCFVFLFDVSFWLHFVSGTVLAHLEVVWG